VATLLNYRLDSLLISALAGVRSLGYYSVAVSIGEIVWYLANSVSSVLFPHVASLTLAEAARVTAIVCRNTLLISLAGCLALLVGGRYVILVLFGPQLLPALPALWLLLPGILALSAGKVMSSYLSGIGKPIYASIVAPGNLVLTIILDLLLIPRFSYFGAAVASSIVYIAGTAASLYIFKLESGQSLLRTVLPQFEDVARWRGIAVRGLSRVRAWGT
jgi:O-antigen/teichoic acid export membrane protein